jgi:hypothetical protein
LAFFGGSLEPRGFQRFFSAKNAKFPHVTGKVGVLRQFDGLKAAPSVAFIEERQG